MDVTWALITVIFSLIIYLYLKMREKYKYWERKGVAHLKPLPIFGSSLPQFLFKMSINELYTEAYNKFPNEKAVGLYELLKPTLIIRDPKLIETVLVKDFQYFTDHIPFLEEDNIVGGGLFQLKGNIWRAVRHKISPTFTTGKLKLMFNGMVDCTEGMINIIRNNLNTDYEVTDALSSYTLDVVANLIFGIRITDENARKEFLSKGSEIFNITHLKFIKLICMLVFPKLTNLFKIELFNKEVLNYFEELIKNTFEQRLTGKFQRNDYVELLLKLKQKGSLEIEKKDEDDSYLFMDDQAPVENVEITDKILYGQAFQFLTAGFEPASNTLVFIMYNLARFPETQKLARQDIKKALAKHGGYTYQAIKEMTYLEQCIQETLRIYSINPFIFRECTKQYVTEDGLVVEKGQQIIIPVQGIHMDPQYYPDPETFIPERLPPNSSRNNFTYLPFGDGPRMCIGFRFALLELKLGLAKIIDNFQFTLSPKTKVPFEINKQAFIPLPTTKILFNMSPA